MLVPGIFAHLFDKAQVGKSSGLVGLFDSITIILTTPCEYFLITEEIPWTKVGVVVEVLVYSCSVHVPRFAVLSSGIVALTLNLLLPAEHGEEPENIEFIEHEASPSGLRHRNGADAEKNNSDFEHEHDIVEKSS